MIVSYGYHVLPTSNLDASLISSFSSFEDHSVAITSSGELLSIGRVIVMVELANRYPAKRYKILQNMKSRTAKIIHAHQFQLLAVINIRFT